MIEPSRINAFSAFFTRIQVQVGGLVARLSPRERLLLGAMALIALALVPIKAFDMSQSGFDRLTDAQSKLETARQNSGRASAVFDHRIDTQFKAVQRWSWTAPSAPVAQVMLQQQLVTFAAQAKMTDIEVKTTDDTAAIGPVKFLRLELNAKFDWLTLSDFLHHVADAGKGFVLVSVVTEGDAPATKVRVVFDMPVTIKTETATAAAGKAEMRKAEMGQALARKAQAQVQAEP